MFKVGPKYNKYIHFIKYSKDRKKLKILETLIDLTYKDKKNEIDKLVFKCLCDGKLEWDIGCSKKRKKITLLPTPQGKNSFLFKLYKNIK